MKFEQACKIFYECIEIVSVAYCEKPGKGFYLFSANINKFRSILGEEYWEHLLEIEREGMGTAIDLVLGKNKESIYMVFVASGMKPPGKILNRDYSTPLIKFIKRIEKLKIESKTQ